MFLFDPSGSVLLIRFVTELKGEPFVFWVTPGGEVEAGESDLVAAGRELFEELGLRLQLQGPVHHEAGGTYTHLGETVRNSDVFFLAICERDEPRLQGVTAEEIALMREARWWTAEELDGTTERIFPEGLPTLVRRLQGREDAGNQG